jgi:hypothetical protein
VLVALPQRFDERCRTARFSEVDRTMTSCEGPKKRGKNSENKKQNKKHRTHLVASILLMEIPIIDLSPFILWLKETKTEKVQEQIPTASDVLHVISEWRKAFETLGFATIVGHGLSEGN